MACIVHNENGEELIALRPDEYRQLYEERDVARVAREAVERLREILFSDDAEADPSWAVIEARAVLDRKGSSNV